MGARKVKDHIFRERVVLGYTWGGTKSFSHSSVLHSCALQWIICERVCTCACGSCMCEWRGSLKQLFWSDNTRRFFHLQILYWSENVLEVSTIVLQLIDQKTKKERKVVVPINQQSVSVHSLWSSVPKVMCKVKMQHTTHFYILCPGSQKQRCASSVSTKNCKSPLKYKEMWRF